MKIITTYKRTTQAVKPDKAELHDHLGLHAPVTKDSCTFCLSCGFPIHFDEDANLYSTTTDAEIACRVMENTHMYNKYTINLATSTPQGAFWVASNIRGSDRIRTIACKTPLMAYQYARFIDKKPSKQTRTASLSVPEVALDYALHVDKRPNVDTWKAVLSYHLEKEIYKKTFGVTEEDLRKLFARANK